MNVDLPCVIKDGSNGKCMCRYPLKKNKYRSRQIEKHSNEIVDAIYRYAYIYHVFILI